MDSKQFRILIQMLEAIRLTLRPPAEKEAEESFDFAGKMAVQALKDAESLEASEYFQEGRHEHC